MLDQELLFFLTFSKFIPIILKMSNYGKAQYWQQSYSKKTQPFDWYQRFYSIKQQIRTSITIRPQTTVLIPGCGSSRLGQEMIDQGYCSITCIDYSMNCIKNMSEKYKQKIDKIRFECMDARSLAFPSQFFDGIVDKALLDSLLCSQNSSDNIYKMLCEFNRVLKKNGVYVLLSYEPPSRRLPMLEKSHFNWKVTVEKIPKTSSNNTAYSILDEGQQAGYYYLYTCVKQEVKK